MAYEAINQQKTSHKSSLLLSTTAITGIRSIAVIAAGMVGLAANTAHAQTAADALPTSGSVASGTATIVYDAVDPRLDVNQTSNNAIFDWDTFDIGTDASVFFNQNSATSIAVNRVSDTNPSQILGNLTADGQVVVLNQNGVFFGSSANVDVSGLVASTGTIDAGAFIADGSINLSNINAVSGAKIENRGLITIKNSGLAAFVAPHLINNGIINAELGRVALAAGDTATVDLFGDGLVQFALNSEIEGAIIENGGTIAANGGTIAMTTSAAKGIVDSVVNLDGVLEAKTVGVKNGKIILGGANTNVNVSATVEASGKKGKATITGEKIVMDGADIQAKTTINADGADADILFKGANKFFNLVAISRDDILVEAGASILSNRIVSLTANNEDNDGLSVLQVEGLIQTTNGNGKGKITLNAHDYFVEIDPTGSIITNGSDFTAISNHGFDIDSGATVSLGNGNVFIDAPDVNLGADIDTTGTITGTALTVDVENDTAEIQDGVDVSASGATVNVAAGTFNESVNIDKAIGIFGVNKNQTIVTPTSNTQDGFTIDGDINGDVSIYRMGISGGQDGIDVRDTAVGLNRLTISGVHFEDNLSTGFRITGDSANRVIISNSSFVNNGHSLSPNSGNGDILFYHYNGDLVVRNTNIENTSPLATDGRTAADYGIQIIGAPAFALSGDITLDNVNVAGNYRAAQIGIQQFAGLKSLNVTDVTIGGTTPTSNDGGFGALYLGSIGNAGITDIDLGSLTFDTLDPALNYLANYTLMDIDATGTSFEGVIGNTATVEQSFAIEDRVTHKMDDPTGTIGLVTWKDGTLFATTNNAGIQHAVNIADAGNDIYVDDGTYNESVTVDKTVQLYGNNHGLAGTDAARGDETIVDPNSPAFHVTADDVVIDGFLLTGGAGDSGVFVDNVDRATITNNIVNTVSGDGIFLNKSNGSTVSNNYLHDIGDDAIQANGSDTITITNNTVERVGDAGIAVISGSSNATITGNTVTETDGGFGIRASGTGSVNVSGNTVTNAGDANRDFQNDAIHIDGGYSSGTINDNIVDGSADSGIEIEGTSNLVADNNTVSNTAGNGIYVNGSDFTQVTNSTITNTGANGILVNPSHDVEIIGNDIIGAQGDGIRVEDSDRVLIEDNDIFAFVDVDVDPISVETNVGAGGDGIHVINGENAIIKKNRIKAGIDSASNASSSVTALVSAVAGNGIHVENNAGVKINKNKILGVQDFALQNAALKNGILVEGSENAKVKKNKIFAVGENGIYISDSNNANVIKNKIDETGGAGILVNPSLAVLLSGNTIDNTGSHGVHIDNSADAEIIGNFIGTNGGTENINGDGIFLEKAHGADVIGNTITETNSPSNAFGSGIQSRGSNGIYLAENTISNIDWDGVRIAGGNGITVHDNTITNSQRTGIYSGNAANNIITKNTITGTNSHHGIDVQRGKVSTKIRGNTVSDTNREGILVGRTAGLVVRNNTIDNTGADGIDVSRSANARIVWNYVGENGGDDNIGTNGIRVASSNGAKIRHNNVYNTSDDGIDVQYSHGARIRHNDVRYIGEDGIDVENSSGVRITDNKIRDIEEDGIDVEGQAKDIRIRRNKIRRVGDDGIDVEGVSHVDIRGNLIRKASDDGIIVKEFGNAYIINNDIAKTGDDGIEAVDGNYVRIARNTLNRIGYRHKGKNNDFFGADAIHVRNVGNRIIDNKKAFSIRDITESDKSRKEPRYYGVEIINNKTIQDVHDDGIQVLFSGDTLIKGNEITNVGVNPSFLGGDAIQVIGAFQPQNGQGMVNSVSTQKLKPGMAYGKRFVKIVDNKIDTASDDGVEVIGVNEVRIKRNKIKDVSDDGIKVVGFGRYPEMEPDYPTDEKKEIFSVRSYGPQFNAVISDNKVRRSGGDGIETTGLDRVVIKDNKKINRSGENGIFISGPLNGKAIISGNELNNNPVGMRFESGKINLKRTANVINGGSIGLQFDPFLNRFEEQEVEKEETVFRSLSLSPFIGPVSDLKLAGKTFGTTEFNGQSDFYIRLEDGALFNPGTPTILDATQVSFDGDIPGGGAIDPSLFNKLDGMIHDFNDEGNRGLIFFGFPNNADISDILPDSVIADLAKNPSALLTILGLPFVSPTGTGGLPASLLNNLAPAAGGEEDPEALNDLETAAGSEKVGCWTDAFSSLGSGAPSVSYNMSTDPLSQVSDANGCGL